ncbi:Disease resistance protein [Artemisia annua]|uniref:Disease resistance protein n=1 Tax=Artemisia annua TaxID=35608 RepID=A0A2U1PQ55_ARTAN|nr:Disease resistance protein [Artemisia annua]
METRVKDVVSSLEVGTDEVLMIGIKGIGGGGKTTTARAVFDHLSADFEAKSFIENVREVSNASMFGLKNLQEQVLSKVLNERVTLDSVNDGKNMMKRRYAFGRENPLQGYEELSGKVVRYAAGLPLTVERSLITISKHEVLGMHDHIEEMGKNIVRREHPDEPNRHSRLWIDEEIEDILANDMGTKATRCLKLDMSRRNSRIVMKGDILEFPEDLGQLECLEELCLSSTKIKHLPDSIYMLKHLKYLKVKNSDLHEKVPEDLGQLKCLEKLYVSSEKIEYLPDSICMLKRLKLLDVTFCSCLGKLPEDIGQLECLEELCLSSTKIKQLPDSICMLKHLKTLTVTYSDLLEKLPEDLGQLECLEKLYVSSKKIEYLPDGICMLKRLKSLDVRDCCRLGKLPEDIGRSSVMSVMTGNPLGRIQILKTDKSSSHCRGSAHALRSVLREEDPRALYKGWFPLQHDRRKPTFRALYKSWFPSIMCSAEIMLYVLSMKFS